MLLKLKAHPSISPKAVDEVTVTVTRLSPTEVRLHYEVIGNLVDIVVPEWADFHRADELWRSTCLEAFVRGPAQSRYFEFNASPSGQWAGYAFDSYREGMRNEDSLEPWAMERAADDVSFAVSVDLDFRSLGFEAGAYQLALSAVIEETGGEKSYWALAHPSDKPDFHHPDSFVLELP